MSELLEQIGSQGRASAHVANVREGEDTARWAAVTFTDPRALKELVRDAGGMGDAVHTFYALHDEAPGCAARDEARFETVRNQNRLMLEGPLGASADGIEVRTCPGWTPALAELFSVVPPGEWAVTLRDEAWFASRLGTTDRIEAWGGDELLGFAASQEAQLAGESALWVVDWHTRSEAGTIALAGALLERASAGRRVGWILPDVVPDWLVLQRLGARIESTPWFLDVRTFSRKTTDRWLQQHWMYTLADFPGMV